MRKIGYKTRPMKIVEEREGAELEEILRHKFVDEIKSTKLIADELRISYVTCFRWLRLAGIYSHKLNIKIED
jgi:DNA invertase Pin-like site-specific DNA recombinase